MGVESKRGEEGRLGAGLLVARVCHLVRWQLCKLPLRLPLPLTDLATVDSLLKILCDNQPCLITLWEHTQP